MGKKKYVSTVLQRRNRNVQKAYKRCRTTMSVKDTQSKTARSCRFHLSEWQRLLSLCLGFSAPNGTALGEYPMGGSAHWPGLPSWQIVHRYQKS